MNSKLVYSFAAGDGRNKMLLGGKGANLCEMTQIGLKVPPGFVITTEACLDYLDGEKAGREHADERIYFNAVGLAYTDVAIAYAMYQRATEAGFGQDLRIQKEMIFEHAHLKEWVHLQASAGRQGDS